MELKPINKRNITLNIVGISPMIQHAWSEKAKDMMRQKGSGRKTKDREPRDPHAESEAATYRTADGQYGVPAMAIKSAIISAAHKDLGIEKTLVRKALFFPSADNIPMECTNPVIREDMVRIGAGTADIRYRPMFEEWSVKIHATIDADLLRPEDLATLIDRAGFGVGIGEWRPEKGGDFGRFQLDTTQPMEVE